jgi:methionyl aminopeptidase
MIIIKTEKQIKKLKDLGKRHREVLDILEEKMRPGVNSSELESLTLEEIKKQGAEPAFKGYMPSGAPRPYPCALCIAPNSIVVHGIPTELKYTLKEGDIVGIDIGLKKDGVITDAGRTVGIGKISPEAKKLLSVTKEALLSGVSMAREGNTVGHIGHTIESYARKNKYGLVYDLCGHGVGVKVHEDPQVPNFGKKGTGEELKENMVLAIEPMFTLGKGTVVFDNDGYTVHTCDNSLSAHFEHNVVITKNDPFILV